MDFGKIEDLSGVDFTLPDDHNNTDKLLKSLKGKKKKQKVYIGCAKWGIKEWVGKLYPPKTKEKDFVTHYVTQFNCIELNATHYRIPEPAWIERWKQSAGKDFKFCPKFPQMVSHMKRLKNCENETNAFYKAIDGFGGNLGTSFLQLPPNFTPKSHEQLTAYLKSLPKDADVSVEFRHPEWFKDNEIANDTFAMINELGFGSVITDTSGRRDCAHMRLTNSTAFIRFVGNSLHLTDYTRIDDWVKRLKKWLAGGLETVYFMMHMHDEKDSPELTAYTIRQMNKHCKLDLNEPILFN